jgi:hypothetical protein
MHTKLLDRPVVDVLFQGIMLPRLKGPVPLAEVSPEECYLARAAPGALPQKYPARP